MGCTVNRRKPNTVRFHPYVQWNSLVGRSPTSTVSSGSGTGVAAIGTISVSGDGVTLRPSPSGGVVDRGSRAAKTELDSLMGCSCSITILIRLPMTNYRDYKQN